MSHDVTVCIDGTLVEEGQKNSWEHDEGRLKGLVGLLFAVLPVEVGQGDGERKVGQEGQVLGYVKLVEKSDEPFVLKNNCWL